MYVKKMDEVTFKEYFESHLKKLATCEDYDICLTDGSKFNYGTYAEGCPTGTCTELTIDTNGNRLPNKSGKDIFTMLVTDRGIKALGESNMCETGLDCGAYILANHKLYDGTVDEVAPPEHTPNPPEEEQLPQPTPEELAQEAYNNCMADSSQQICVKVDGTKDYKTFEACKGDGGAVCTLANGDEVKKVGNYYARVEEQALNYSEAEAYCTSRGMRLPSIADFNNINSTDSYKDNFASLNYNWDGHGNFVWVSDPYPENTADGLVIYLPTGKPFDDDGILNKLDNKGQLHGAFCIME